MRAYIDLNGAWAFQIDPAAELAFEQIDPQRTVQVPGPWQAQFDDLHLTAGVGWYRRRVDVPEAWRTQRVFLCFGAVDYFAEVWVNGQHAGDHEGGYLPFDIEVSALLRYGGENEIVVRVVDPGPGEYDIFPEFPFDEIPHGKQSWYGPIGGLWQPVKLETRPACYIDRVQVTPRGLGGDVSAGVWLAGEGPAGQIELRCLSAAGEEMVALAVDAAAGRDEMTFTIPDPQLWELDSPTLYTLEVGLRTGGVVVDLLRVRFGIRTFEARDGRLWLNGKLFYMRGALDQAYYHPNIYTPPSLNFLRMQMRRAKAMGLNCLRHHIKVPDPRYVQAADEVGVLLWVDVPSWGKLTEDSARRVRETFAGMVSRDWNHPSIVMWSLVNENWGTDLPGAEVDRDWLLKTFQWAKSVDPNRLIVDNSPCLGNFHMQTDVEDFHFYAAMPDSMDNWQSFVTNFAGRAGWTFSSYGDAVRTGEEPLVVSEFGNWGLPDIESLKANNAGRAPWWFMTGKDWQPGVVWPGEAEARFEAAGLGRVFEGWQNLAEAAQWAQYRALKHEIEVMRAEPALSGYVITEFTDLHWECNGLLDMDRNPRVFAGRLAQEFNADTVIIPRWERLAYWAGEPVEIGLSVSHFGASPLEGASLVWALGKAGGALELPVLAPGEVRDVGTIGFEAPSAPTPPVLVCRILLPGDHEVARCVQPFRFIEPAAELAARVYSEDAGLAAWLTAQGYSTGEPYDLRVVINTKDKVPLQATNPNEHVLLIATGESQILPGIQVERRQGTPRAGEWASSFMWAGPELSGSEIGGLLDFTWHDVIPQHVITGVPREDVLAGLFVGWVHMAAALAARVESLTVTTFPVVPPGDSPLRSDLLHRLIAAALA